MLQAGHELSQVQVCLPEFVVKPAENTRSELGRLKTKWLESWQTGTLIERLIVLAPGKGSTQQKAGLAVLWLGHQVRG